MKADPMLADLKNDGEFNEFKPAQLVTPTLILFGSEDPGVRRRGRRQDVRDDAGRRTSKSSCFPAPIMPRISKTRTTLGLPRSSISLRGRGPATLSWRSLMRSRITLLTRACDICRGCGRLGSPRATPSRRAGRQYDPYDPPGTFSILVSIRRPARLAPPCSRASSPWATACSGPKPALAQSRRRPWST